MPGGFHSPGVNKLKGLVEEKVNNFHLGVFNDENERKKFQKSSPSLRELQGGNSRVKALSRIFEKKSDVCDQKESNGKKENFVRKISVEIESPEPTKIYWTVSELLKTENTYIQSLENGMKTYLEFIKGGGDKVPAALRHQAHRLFGNIEEIYKFNKERFCPQLLACKGKVQAIAEMITNFIIDESFYCYVVYYVNYKNVEPLISNFIEFFKKNFNGRLGIESFLILPVQRLPRLQMILCAMLKELSKDLNTVDKAEIAACCIAEKNVQRLLTRCNDAMFIHDIVETKEFKASVQLGILATMQSDYGVNNDEPAILLVPRQRGNAPPRKPFNIFSLGKFLKISTLQVKEVASDKMFLSKLFIFDRYLLYTKMSPNRSLSYRKHFSYNKDYNFMLEESRFAFRVTNGNRNNDVLFFSFDDPDLVSDVKKTIGEFYDPRRSIDSAFSSLPVFEDNEIVTDDESDWDLEACEDLDETIHIANSRFYICSPILKSN